MIPMRVRSPEFISSSLLVFGREQVAHGKAPIRPPAIRHLSHFVFGRKVVEAVRSLDRAPEREVAGEKDVGPVESHEQEPARGPQPDSGHLGQGCLDLVVGHARERLVAQASVDEPSASARNVSPFRAEKPLSRSTCGSAASSSAGDGRCPPNRSWRCEMIARVERPTAVGRRPGRRASRRHRAEEARPSRPADGSPAARRSAARAPGPPCEGTRAPQGRRSRLACGGRLCDRSSLEAIPPSSTPRAVKTRCSKHGDPSIAHQRHVDAADRRRLLRHSHGLKVENGPRSRLTWTGPAAR